MIERNEHFPKQMNGPVISSYGNVLEKEFSDADTIIDYLHGLSINTAQETDLENIGRLVGYPRPLVPEGFNQENIMVLSGLPLTTDPQIGLATVGSEVGGRLSTTQLSNTGFMALGTYRNFLQKVALLKRYGITLYSVSEICALISTNFTIDWDELSDIEVTFHDAIGYKNMWILSQLFYRMATEPQIAIYSED